MAIPRLAFVSVLSVVSLVGCEVGVEPVGVAPGYYYDEEYFDGGRYHPRDYWFHDSRGWIHRDGPARDAVMRDRASVGYARGGAVHGGGGFGGGHGR